MTPLVPALICVCVFLLVLLVLAWNRYIEYRDRCADLTRSLSAANQDLRDAWSSRDNLQREVSKYKIALKAYLGQ